MIGIVVMASGRGSNFRAVLEAIRSGGLTGCAVVGMVADRPGTGAESIAAEFAVPVTVVDRKGFADRGDFSRALLKTVSHYDPDLILMLGYMRIIDSEFIERYRNRIINIHPSLLPAFQGINAHQVAIDYGVRISGATVHFVDEGTDTGPIILQAAVQVPEGADAEVLADLIRPEEHRLVVEATRLFCAGRLRVEGRRVRILASGDEEGFSA